MRTALEVWQDASEIGYPECDTCAHALHRREPYPDAGLDGYMHSPRMREVLRCGLKEANAGDCDAWLRYSERYAAAVKRAQAAINVVLDEYDDNYLGCLQAVHDGAPDAAENLQAWLKRAADKYAEELA
jgi:hypothetical protein